MKKSFNVAILIVTLLSAAFNASAQEPGAKSEKPLNSLDDLRKRGDEFSRRDANTKHYLNNDGSYTAIVTSGPIHYNLNNAWTDIDTGIIPTNDGTYAYSNTSNLMETHFNAHATGGIMSRTIEGDVKEFISPALYWEASNQEHGRMPGAAVQALVNGNTLTYQNIFPGITAKYTVLNGKRKLVYVISSDIQGTAAAPAGAEYLVFEEKVILPAGWAHKATSKGIVINDTNGKAIYLYEQPFSNEAAHEYLYEDNTVMTGSREGNILTIKLKVKAGWLLASDRSYPVIVDPAATVYPDNSDLWTVQMNSAGGGTSGSPAAGRASTGTWYRGAIVFNTSSIPVSTISSAQVALTTGNVAGTINSEFPIGLTQSKYALVNWADDFTQLYNYVTDPANTSGDYAIITNAGAIGTTNTYSIGNQGALDVASKLGSTDSFFCVTLRQGWDGGTATDRFVVYDDHTYGATAPQLIVNYTPTGDGCRPVHNYANCAAIGDCDYIGIGNVQLNTLNSTTGYANTPIGYNFYNNATTTLTLTNSYTLQVRYQDGGVPVNQGIVAAWIDWNNDKVFTANEYIGTSSPLNNNQVHTFNVTVPQTAAIGEAMLRVRSVFSDETLAATDACETKDYGETEDYKITIETNLGVNSNAFAAVTVYPNPTTGVVTVQCKDTVTSITVYNLLGQKVTGAKDNRVDLSAYPAGGYILSVVTENGQQFSTKIMRN